MLVSKHLLAALPLLLTLALLPRPAFASKYDILNLDSGPDAEAKATVITDAEKAKYTKLMNAMELLNDPKQEEIFKEGLKRLGAFISNNPDCADAYLMRATVLYNIARSTQYDAILEDINNALKYHSSYKKTAFEDTAGMYGLRAKVYKDSGNLQQAIKDLDTAIKINPDNAIEHSGTNPDEAPQNGQWGKNDFNEIIKKYPKDYRGYLFRAVYYKSFVIMLKQDHYKAAIADLNKAIGLNPTSAIAHYLLGAFMHRRLVWGPKSKKDYSLEAKVMLKGQAIWMAHPVECKKIETAYSNAIKSSPRMREAYSARAELYLETMKYQLAIKDYDKVIVLDPDYGGAYHDRGLANIKLGNYRDAVNDFTSAINAKKKLSNKYQAYMNRAKAYSNDGQLDEAIRDYTKAAEMRTGEIIILMNLPQFRSIFSEYDDLDDQTLLSKLHDKFYPNMDLKGFTDSLLRENKDWQDTTGYEIYESRGDTCLKAGSYQEALNDYKRAMRSWTSIQMDRWKYLFSTSMAQHYLDINTLEKPKPTTYNFWLKNEYSKAKPEETSYSVQNMVIDCKAKTLQSLSIAGYNSAGEVMHSSNYPGESNVIVPDSIGETLYKGWCGY